jgi:hypothetical protein
LCFVSILFFSSLSSFLKLSRESYYDRTCPDACNYILKFLNLCCSVSIRKSSSRTSSIPLLKHMEVAVYKYIKETTSKI